LKYFKWRAEADFEIPRPNWRCLP